MLSTHRDTAIRPLIQKVQRSSMQSKAKRAEYIQDVFSRTITTKNAGLAKTFQMYRHTYFHNLDKFFVFNLKYSVT